MTTTRAGILVVDDEWNHLGELSLALIRANLGIVYTNDLDEAILLAAEQPHAPALALVSHELADRAVVDLVKRLGMDAPAIVPVGGAASDANIESLKLAGVRWALWGSASSEEALYVVAAILWDRDPSELRFDLRAPVDLPANLQIEGGAEHVSLCDLSPGGACVISSADLASGASVNFSMRLKGKNVEAKARVAWVAKPQSEGGETRVGLCFDDCSPEAEALIRGHARAWMDRYKLDPEA